MSAEHPIFNSFIAHEPAAHFGKRAGGAAGVALEHARNFPNGRIVSPRNGAPPPVTYADFDKPETGSNDALLETFSTDAWLDRFNQMMNGGTNEGHYYVAGGVLEQLGKLDIYMGHSWDRVVGLMDQGRTSSNLRQQTERKILTASKGFIVSTKAEAKGLADQYGADIPGGAQGIADRTHVIPLGVDHHIFNVEQASRERADVRKQMLPPELADENNLVFYILGRFSPQKGHLPAIQSMEALLSQCPDLPVSLSMVGGPLDGTYFNQMNDYVRGLPDHIQKRILFHDAMPGHLAHAAGDIFMGPSTWETWFLSMTEAMACGKPVIVSHFDQMPILDEVAGEGGIMVNRTDIDQIASSMYEVATDAPYRQYLGEQNVQTAKGYTWEKTGVRLEQVVQSIQ